jgi:hypothetical protein
MRRQLGFRDVPKGLTENCAKRALIHLSMNDNGQCLTGASRRDAAKFNMAAALLELTEAEESKDA